MYVTEKQLSTLVKTALQSKKLKVPSDWNKDFEDEFNKKREEFRSCSSVGYTVIYSPAKRKIAIDAASEINQKLLGFIDDVCSILSRTWSQWQNSVMFSNVMINASVGIIPPLGMKATYPLNVNLLVQQLKSREKYYRQYGKAIFEGFVTALETWQKGFTHQNIIFPAGALCVATMPPTPSLPASLSLGQSPGEPLFNENTLQNLMLSKYGKPEQFTKEILESFASAISKTFTIWKNGTIITNIIGAGGVAPTPLPGPVVGAIGTGGKLV